MAFENPEIEERIKQSFALAAEEKPAYAELYPWLEGLFLIQAQAKRHIEIESPAITSESAQTRWSHGFPLLQRWELPVNVEAAETILQRMQGCLPAGNRQLSDAWEALSESLLQHAGFEEDFWRSFLQQDLGPWEEWVASEGLDFASVIFLARSCMRPSFEVVAEDLVGRFPVPESWGLGYCPVCGSLPALLHLQGEGERGAFCSWCGTQWVLQRLQCPYCDNRNHEALGYLYAEAEPHYRIQYCESCRHYFKLIDLRERLYPPFLPLEEWTTLHLDLIAQRAGWIQAPSVAPGTYRQPE